MKKTLMMLALVATTTLATAQTAGKKEGNDKARAVKKEQMKNMSPDERAKHNTEKMTAKLGLTPDQASQWQAAALELHNKNQPLREQMQGSTTPQQRETLRGQMKENRQAFNTKVETFLTAEQKHTLAQEKKQHHGKKYQGQHKGEGKSKQKGN